MENVIVHVGWTKTDGWVQITGIKLHCWFGVSFKLMIANYIDEFYIVHINC